MFERLQMMQGDIVTTSIESTNNVAVSPAQQEIYRGVAAAFPIMTAVFIFFIVIGMALPVLPLQVHNVLGFGPFVVGGVAGCQFVAALISRLWAGRLTDTRGSKFAVSLGLGTAIAGGIFYWGSSYILKFPVLSVLVLLCGRTLLGGSESLIITGGILWALQLVTPDRSAKVIAWVGMAMFAALAAGAPVGSLIFERWKFSGIAIVTVVMSFVALLLIQPIHSFIPQNPPKNAKMLAVVKMVFLPGTGFALSGITFGAITTFFTLFFSVKHWEHGALAFMIFAVMLIVARIFGGHLPDRFGGAKVTLYCLIIQAIGLILIGTAHLSWVAMLGAAVAGTGFSLVFPGLGLEAINRVPVESRGLAMGVYNAFLDVTLGFGSPALGYLAGKFGLESVFLVSSIAAILAVPVSVLLLMLQNAASLNYRKLGKS
jgi:MFS family permease